MQVVYLNGENVEYGIRGDLERGDLIAPKKVGDGVVTFVEDSLAWIRPMRVGICGTDLALLDGTHASTPGVVPGHEIAGVVEAVGDAVTHLREGDRVVVDANVACGVCKECRSAAKNRCMDLTTAGIFFDGGMSRTMAIPAAQLHTIPDSISWDIAALYEPLSCIVHGIKQLPRPIIGRAVVVGGGPIGYLWVLALRAYGIDEIAVAEPFAYRRSMMRASGSTYRVLDANDLAKDVWDIVIDAAGVPNLIPTLIRLARPGAQISLFGQQKFGATVDAFPIVEANQKELAIVGSYATAYEAEETIRLLRKDLPFAELITHRFQLVDVQAGYTAMREGTCMKALILPNGEEL